MSEQTLERRLSEDDMAKITNEFASSLKDLKLTDQILTLGMVIAKAAIFRAGLKARSENEDIYFIELQAYMWNVMKTADDVATELCLDGDDDITNGTFDETE